MAGGRLVSVGAGRGVTAEGLASLGAHRVLATSIGRGTIKHLAVRRRIGAAFIIDRAGADVVVAMMREGVDVLPQAGEASHPVWSASGRLAWSMGSSIAIRDPVTGEVDELSVPIRGASVFAPVFLSERRIAAVVSAPPDERVPEGEQLADLWETEIAGTRWRRLTHFRAGGDRRVTVRTPIARAGGIDFVRVSARGSSTEAPTFELWRFEHGSASLVRRLESERYLAGRLRRAVRLEPSRSDARQTLAPGRAGGEMHTIGCGAVLVDPMDVVDPDRQDGGSYPPSAGICRMPARAEMPAPKRSR